MLLEMILIQMCHFYENSFGAPVYTLKLRGIDYSYLKKLLKSLICQKYNDIQT